MPDIPAWIQEIRDRVDKATPGPWTAEDANPHKPHKRFAFYIPAIMSAPSMPQYDGLTEEDAEFIAHSRADVPRLIGLVGEMAGVLESFRDTNCQRMGCMQCRDDVCLSKLWGRLDDVLAKYHGEAESND